MERQILTRIETLPNKVRLTTTRANQGSIDDLKDNSKGCNKELQGDDNEKEKAERTSSVYGNIFFYFFIGRHLVMPYITHLIL